MEAAGKGGSERRRESDFLADVEDGASHHAWRPEVVRAADVSAGISGTCAASVRGLPVEMLREDGRFMKAVRF